MEASVTNGQKRARIDVVPSTERVLDGNQASSPIKRQSRRKSEPKRTLSLNEVKVSESNNLKSQQDGVLLLKVRLCLSSSFLPTQIYMLFCCVSSTFLSILQETLSHCLSSDLVRRWCTFEWFYGAIDYPWFANKEFVGYLNHVGLGHIPRLTRVEWGVIRR